MTNKIGRKEFVRWYGGHEPMPAAWVDRFRAAGGRIKVLPTAIPEDDYVPYYSVFYRNYRSLELRHAEAKRTREAWIKYMESARRDEE